MAVRRDRAMASSATCGACARAATFTAKVNDSSAAASSRSSLYSSTVAPDRPAAEPRLEVRSASPTWCAERRTSSDGLYCRTSGAGARSGCAGRRAGSVSASSVAALPGAMAAAVSIWKQMTVKPNQLLEEKSKS